MKKIIRKTAVVLGASSGIGKATAERFAREGWQVVLAAPNLKTVQEVSETLDGYGHISIELDVTSEKHIENLRKTVKDSLGGFHTLVNSIGISKSGTLIDSDFEDWNTALDVMLYGAVKAIRALVPLMENGGRIVNITSIHHKRVAHGSSAYGMAKAAITQMTRSLAVELAPRHILSNTIAPGFIETPMSIKSDGQNELESKWFKDNYITYGHLPLKRAGRPEEIAGIAWFLAGPDASYMTGSVVTADGGLTITF